MSELHERFDRAWHEGEYHRLLLLAVYVFDFLMIHPFQDGNGRMSRLATALLLYHAEYEVGRFVSWEKLISDSRESYYEALEKSTAGWHDGHHDLTPWLSYFFGVLILAYAAFEQRIETVALKGSKSAAVRNFVRTGLSDVFTVADIRKAVPHIGDGQIGRVLRQLQREGIVVNETKGRAARWRRLTSDF